MHVGVNLVPFRVPSLVTVLCICVLALAARPASVRAQQRRLSDYEVMEEAVGDPGTGYRIEYDLPGYPGDIFEVSVEWAGVAVPDSFLSGDVGPGIEAGNAHTIVFRPPDPTGGGPIDRTTVGVFAWRAYQASREEGGMVLVPGGPFVQGGFVFPAGGDGSSARFDSTRVDSVRYVPPFWIDRNEVTNEQFVRFLDSGHSRFYHPNMGIEGLPGDRKRFAVRPGHEGHPVTYVNWYAASAFAAWAGKALPRADEWEKAARGSDQRLGTFHGVGIGYPYPWGGDPPDVLQASFLGASSGVIPCTTSVGFFDGRAHNGVQTRNGESPYGLYDMAGNVWEWTRTPVAVSLREGQSTFADTLFVVRGGGWRDPPENLLVTVHPARIPEIRASDIGFRCVKYLDDVNAR